MKSWRVKIERANEHFAHFNTEVRAFLEAKPYEISSDLDPATGEEVGKIKPRFAVPARFAAIIGDVLNNLRSALDHLCVALTGNERTSFPVVRKWNKDNTTEFDAKVKGAAAEAIAFIRLAQPGSSNLGAKHPLAILARLNNKDKHRALTLVGISVEMSEFSLRMPDGGGLFVKSLVVGGKISPDTETQVYRLDAQPEPGKKLQVNTRFSFQVTFGEDGAVNAKGVQPVVQAIIQFVTELVEELERFVA